ncbi:hypothetical protein IJ182_08185 [bacterium]|nr:hypothetical protein [bacterium]
MAFSIQKLLSSLNLKDITAAKTEETEGKEQEEELLFNKDDETKETNSEQSIELSNIAYLSQKSELASKLISTSDPHEREIISAQIKALEKQHETEQDQIKEAEFQYKLDNAKTPEEASNIRFEYQLSKLQDQLSQTTDKAKRAEISNTIKELKAQHEAEVKQAKNQEVQNNFDKAYANVTTPEERAEISANSSYYAELSELQELLNETTDREQRNQILARIEQLSTLHEQELRNIETQKLEKEISIGLATDMVNAKTENERQIVVSEYNFQQQISALYSQLEETTDSSTRDGIKANIQLLTSRHNQEMDTLAQNDSEKELAAKYANSPAIFTRQELAAKTSLTNQASELYLELSQATSQEQRNAINGKLQELFQNTQQELDNITSNKIEAEYYQEYSNAKTDTDKQIVTMTYEYKKEISELYKQLSQTTDNSIRDEINAQIKALSENYHQELDAISRESFEQEYADAYANATTDAQRQAISSEYAYINERNELIQQLSSTSDIAARDAIFAQINHLDRMHEAEQKAIERQNFEDEYAQAFAKATTDKEKATLKVEYSYQKQTTDLMDKLSMTSNSQERAEIFAQLQALAQMHDVELNKIEETYVDTE